MHHEKIELASEPTKENGSSRTGFRRTVAAIAAMCLLGSAGCQVARKTASLPTEMVAAVVRGPQQKQPDPALLQSEILRFTDDLFGRTSAGLDEYARRANTAEAHEQATKWKVTLCTSALGIATGANPTANVVDLLGLATLTRAFVEQEALKVEPRGALGLWLENTRTLETNAWRIAGEALSEAQQEEFRAAITRWLEENANTDSDFFGRQQEIAMDLRQSRGKATQPGSVFSLVGLDPTAGLDPAVREVTRTRLFAERAMFAMERMPFLFRWQTEMLAGKILRQQEITNALAAADRLSRAVESVSQTAALLPGKVSSEREAIVAALEEQEGKLRNLSAEMTQTLIAGEKMSTSLNTTVVSFDGLMKRFGVGEPDTSPPDTNSAPFNILDYARTAEQVANMAQQLDALIKDASGTMDTPALDKRIAQLGAFSAQARTDAKSVATHAFLLIASLIILGFACALLYRRLSPTRTATAVAGTSRERTGSIGPSSI
jgi:hypothetical protein